MKQYEAGMHRHSVHSGFSYLPLRYHLFAAAIGRREKEALFDEKFLTFCNVCDNILEQSRDSKENARVVELADSLDSGSSVHSGRAGSSPASRTKSPKFFGI